MPKDGYAAYFRSSCSTIRTLCLHAETRDFHEAPASRVVEIMFLKILVGDVIAGQLQVQTAKASRQATPRRRCER
jgi:hypothetical protein